MTSNISALLIAGPTASGKSDLALNLADSLDGVIVNADSMQVYQDLQVLTARPGEEELKRASHKLYGHVDGSVNYSTGKWLEDMGSVLSELQEQDKMPIIVGGTGLYFKALLEGMAPIPDISEEVRGRWRAELQEYGAEKLHQKLGEVDAVLAKRLSPQDGQRIIRALEVFEETGTPLSQWQKGEHSPALLDLTHTYPIVVERDREEIYARCDTRFEKMIEQGAQQEVEKLYARQLDLHLPVMKVIGVPQLISHLCGDISLDEAAESVKTLTRRYAKRQLTWLRRNMIAWNHQSAQDSETILLDILPKLRKNC